MAIVPELFRSVAIAIEIALIWSMVKDVPMMPRWPDVPNIMGY